MLISSPRPSGRPQTVVNRVTLAKAEPQSKPEQLATEQVPLPPRNGLLLLGTFGTDSAPRALIRLPGGKIDEVSKGDKVGGHQVLAIEAAAVVLNVGGTATRLAMP
ncbi:amidophosphoribosyltransferase [Tropicibacter naphthalenivorans]|uniref:Type IV pilus biogenesis n=1 Tax=Tropicibacter naphthalenivorans TaxID=441103 RepID=A0A0N7LZ89_9RHOB|nr:amidophosphoribosyltransferase [Tropicibacter naphthalenivorans]CUH76993.1 Type IV pilus biogenesis [Tropicibacter naphthalenivorans]SMC61766.1 hypothetical protein SAMN04488093_102384 [Tropicibacter naphthalenivorans]